MTVYTNDSIAINSGMHTGSYSTRWFISTLGGLDISFLYLLRMRAVDILPSCKLKRISSNRMSSEPIKAQFFPKLTPSCFKREARYSSRKQIYFQIW